ncbi:MAG TPA: DegV family protein [Bacillota bacterium]|nr:DegV family protein [Bacillota bacterium]HOH10277.1 DegV family protein [Bacillota bacterium]HOY89752.1 DegV family protein [Bacillota bacterium]HQJ24455.1 DegV family protein [Bacillota bacterium]
MRIGLVTDSLSDLTKELYERYSIRMVPLNILFGDENYKDVVDLSPMKFYEMQAESDVLPRTNQPIPLDFENAYKKMLSDYDYIFSLHVSNELSGTIQSAEMAARQINEDVSKKVIEVIDTNQVCFGQAMVVLAAARAIEAGAGVDKVRQEINKAISGVNTIFVPDSLEYLRKNGRIGAASALLGGILNIKPMLEIKGKVVPVEKLRGSKNVIPGMLNTMKSRTAPGSKVYVCVYDALMQDKADELERLIKEEYNVVEMFRATVGPAVGCHCGPHTVAVSWHKA